MTPDRDHLLFQLHYGVRLESMSAALSRRIDRLLAFGQLVLGASVFAAFGVQWVIGLLLVLLSSAAFVWQPGARAMRAALQRQAYAALLVRAPGLDDTTLAQCIVELEANDTDVPGALCHPAQLGVEITLGWYSNIKLSTWEKLVARFAGDLPDEGMAIRRKPDEAVSAAG